ncbi:MAG: hypothetical protein GC182_08970 [Rhodopseudomonas sp.]|nr:hypothetical protein [Rhodopseudomonas sp.]
MVTKATDSTEKTTARRKRKPGAGAPKGNKNAVGNKGGGAQTKYKPEYAKIARNLCVRGATDADLALAFGVAQSTIWAWGQANIDFAESVAAGKDQFDGQVERAFAQRAIGYEYVTEKVFQYEGNPVRVEVLEHVPADVNAGKFWLINRRKDRFKDPSRIVEEQREESQLAAIGRALGFNVIRPVEHKPRAIADDSEPVTIEATAQEIEE